MMKVAILILSIALVGCAVSPQKLGISEQEWNSYSDEQRQKILVDYQQIAAEQGNIKKNSSESETINVKIYDGEVMMQPFTQWCSYQPVTFDLAKNTCDEILLNQLNGAAQTSLRACYKDNLLYLDPSRYDLTKRNGSINFPFSPLWKQGFEYNGVSSSGFVRLKNVTVKITGQNQKSPLVSSNSI